jgi:hypothetical protein
MGHVFCRKFFDKTGKYGRTLLQLDTDFVGVLRTLKIYFALPNYEEQIDLIFRNLYKFV